MQDFLTQLNRIDRLILMLHWADGCSEREISSILRLEPDLVCASIRRLRVLAREAQAVDGASATDRIHQNRPVASVGRASVI